MRIKIGLIVSSLFLRDEQIRKSKENLVKILKNKGFDVEFEDFFELPKEGFCQDKEIVGGKYEKYAKSFVGKADGIISALKSDCQILWVLQGGIGGADMIKRNEERLKKAVTLGNKMLVGYSDVTALHNFAIENWSDGVLCVQGPNIFDFSFDGCDKLYDGFFDDFFRVLGGGAGYDMIAESVNSVKISLDGVFDCVGGSALMFVDDAHVKGYGDYIPWSKELVDNRVVFLESSDNKKVIEMLNKHANFFGNSRAIVFGEFSNNDDRSRGVEDLRGMLGGFLSKMDEKNIPVCKLKGCSFGHGCAAKSRCVPIFLGKALVALKGNDGFEVKMFISKDFSLKEGVEPGRDLKSPKGGSLGEESRVR